MKNSNIPPENQVATSPDQNPQDSVTCLFSNNSIEDCPTVERKSKQDPELPQFSPYAKKQAHTLFSNVARLIEMAPSPDHIGMLTLTFKDNIEDHREAQRRFNSFNTNYLKPSTDIGNWLLTKERQKRGAWHYHVIVTTSADIKTGFSGQIYNWWLDQRNQGKKRRLNTGNNYLRGLWLKNREACVKYGFGIPHLIPMLSTPEAMARYVGKYISKHFETRKPEDKGVRLIQTSQGWPKNSLNFAWNTDNSAKWRRNVRGFANLMECQDLYDLKEKFGPRWAYDRYSSIMDFPEILAEIENEIPF